MCVYECERARACAHMSCKECNGLSSGTLEGCLAGPVVVADEYTFHYLPMVQ